ncbi:hypothetical protein [Haloarcula montana]|uniref:hypothetical protein n=1 Tax=Haloarcula montana TaxID=3111776 RepID=UPI002D772C35|nr:hypothetical protein [Haloarcula sp. GH36]
MARRLRWLAVGVLLLGIMLIGVGGLLTTAQFLQLAPIPDDGLAAVFLMVLVSVMGGVIVYRRVLD